MTETARRIRTGFHRIGIAFAGVALLLGAIGTAVGLYDWIVPQVSPPQLSVELTDGRRIEFRYGDNAADIGRAAAELPGNVNRFDVTAKVTQQQKFVDYRIANGRDQVGVSVGLSLAGAALMYAFAWTLGWIIAAFVGG